jgi:hypothetical protein
MATFKMLVSDESGNDTYQNAEWTPQGLKLGNELINLDMAPRDVHGEEFLANIAFGFKQSGFIWNEAVPTLNVSKQSDKYYEWDKEDSYEEALRINMSAQGEPAEFTPRFSSNRYQVTPYAAAFFLHTEAIANADAQLDLQAAHMNRIMTIMNLASEIRTQTLLQGAASYDASQTLTLTADTAWLNLTTGEPGPNSNPIRDLLGLQETVMLDVNQWIMNPTMFNAFILHPEVQKYIINKSGTPALPSTTQVQSIFSGLFGVAPIKIAKAKRLGSGGTHPYIWNNTAVGIHYPEGTPTGQDSTTAYRFRWNGTGDSPLRGFSQRDGFFVRTIPVDHRGMLGGYRTMLFTYEDLKLVSTFGGARIANAVAAF